MIKDAIKINKSMIPYQFSIPLNNKVFVMEIRYNSECNLFTVALRDRDGNLICTEPLIYGSELFAAHYRAGKYPALAIVPLDESGKETEITWENMNVTVFLLLNNTEGDE